MRPAQVRPPEDGPMDFRLTDEQRLVHETARDFVDRELIPHVRAWEEKGEVPRSFYTKMAGLGFLGAPVPEKYGGAGMDYVSFMLLIEVYAREPGSKRHEGISLFLVPKDAPGFKVTHVETKSKLGLRASPTADLAFEDCRIPEENLIGKKGDGWTQAMKTLNSGRIGIAAGAVGVARAALEAATKYVKDRKAFGRPIGDFQLVREMIAQSAVEIDAARLLTLRAAHLRDLGQDNTLEVSMAKLYGAQMAQRVTDWAVQVHGGYGFSGAFDVERYFRDARILGLYEGTNEIQKLIIAEHILGPSSKK